MKKSITSTLPKHVNSSWKVAIVYAPYYEEVHALVNGAKEALIAAGIQEENISFHSVTGAFEIPLIASAIAKKGEVDALMGFGIVVQGETHHAEHVSREVARAMMDIQMQYLLPFAYEVLHVLNLEQARARAGKGKESAEAVLHSLAQLQQLQS